MITASMTDPQTMGLPVIVVPSTAAPGSAPRPTDLIELGADLARAHLRQIVDADAADPDRPGRELRDLFADFDRAVAQLPTDADPDVFDRVARPLRAEIAAAVPRMEWLSIRQATARAHRVADAVEAARAAEGCER